MIVVQPNAKYLLQPIITDVDKDQSEFPTSSCNRRQAREEQCGQVTIGFGFASHWLRKNGASFANQSEAKVKQNENKSKIDFYNQLKTPNLIYVNTCIITECTKEVLNAINKLPK